MLTPSRILIFSIGLILAGSVAAVQPPYNYSDNTVAELLALLENKDGPVRECAAIFLGDRYRKPGATINGLIYKPNSPRPEFPIPAQVIPRLAEHLRTDPDLSVRMCSVFALRDLRFQTNTTPMLVTGLDDKDVLIRIRTCTALIEISKEYSEPLVERVIATLTQCLVPDGEVEQIWQAVYAAEQLGHAGKPLIPALQRLGGHQSEKVRDYAKRALSKIGPPSKDNGKP